MPPRVIMCVPNFVSPENQTSVLKSFQDMVRYLLLVENLPVNVQDNAGWTPLHEATSNQHTRIAELLLQNGADSNTSSRDGTR